MDAILPTSLVLLAVFGAVAAATYGIAGLIGGGGRDERLRAAPPRPGQNLVEQQGALGQAMRTLPDRLMPRSGDDLSRQRQFLARAGLRSPSALRTYYAARILSMVAALWLFILYAYAGKLETGPLATLGLLALSGLLGYYLPTAYVWNKAVDRVEALKIELPDALDLILVCVESGLAIDAAVTRVADEMQESHPTIAQELQTVGLEMRAGRTREEALTRMIERSGSAPLAGFANLIIQSTRLGASISDALRVAAEDMRTRRLVAAEEKAAKLPVKMMLPMALLLLPVVLMIIATPALLRVMSAVRPSLGG